MMPLLPTKFHEILFSSFRGVALTSCFRSILTPGIPQIVMGDFNVDLLSRKDDVITRTFSAFEQNINSSTTRKLTCPDHIYTRHMKAQQAGVVPIYYSYHDMKIAQPMFQ
jgi:hypothetical protein